MHVLLNPYSLDYIPHQSMRIFLSVVSMIYTNASGSCSEDERALWRNNMDFSHRMDSYARRALGNGAHVTAKLLEDYHPALSLHCAACHGGTVSCGTKHCFLPCLFSSTALGCQECTRRECLASYMECVGTASEDDLPPKPVVTETTTTSIPRRTRPVRPNSTPVPTTSVDEVPTELPVTSELVIP